MSLKEMRGNQIYLFLSTPQPSEKRGEGVGGSPWIVIGLLLSFFSLFCFRVKLSSIPTWSTFEMKHTSRFHVCMNNDFFVWILL